MALARLQLPPLADARCLSAARWIERYNAKLRDSAKKEEKRRLKEFVEAAYQRDPRILRQREEERAERCVAGPIQSLGRRILGQSPHRRGGQGEMR